MKASLACIVLLLSLSQTSLARVLPEPLAVPGGVAIISLRPTSEPKPTATYRGRPILILCHKKHWTAVVGIPLAWKPGTHTLKVFDDNKHAESIGFDVVDKAYATQSLTIKNKRHVNPNGLDMERITSEKQQIQAALKNWNDAQTPNFDFIAPVEGPRSSSFGLRRIFNGEPRRPHRGMDIAAPTGTPIVAPSPGIVTDTGNYFFNGNTIFIDHGKNVVSLYCHLDSIDVKEGDVVNAGDLIGTVGETGRVTGAHLHFAISMNNTMVDPALFLPAPEK